MRRGGREGSGELGASRLGRRHDRTGTRRSSPPWPWSRSPVSGAADARYVVANSAKLQLLTVMRAVGELKSKLQRTNPVEHPTKYNQMFSELVVLEAKRKHLQARSLGAED